MLTPLSTKVSLCLGDTEVEKTRPTKGTLSQKKQRKLLIRLTGFPPDTQVSLSGDRISISSRREFGFSASCPGLRCRLLLVINLGAKKSPPKLRDLTAERVPSCP